MKFSTYLTRLITLMKKRQKQKEKQLDPYICNNMVILHYNIPRGQLASYNTYYTKLKAIIKEKMKEEQTLSFILPPEPGKDKAEWNSRIQWLESLKEQAIKEGN